MEIAAGLTEKLGVDEDKLDDALDTFREANKPNAKGRDDAAKPDRTERDAALAKSLAESLGIEESKVSAAPEELRSATQTERAAGLKAKLDAAADDGTLTQVEADADTKAIEKGIVGGL